MKSLAEQNVAEMGGRGSVLSRQKRDHVRLDDLLQRLGAADPDRQGPVLREIYRLVFPHAFAEESVLWPVMRRVLPDGEALTLRVEREHQEINELVMRLESVRPGSAERGLLLDRIVGLLRQDVRDEEDLLLPRLQERIGAGQLQLLGLAWDAVRRIAPTRAHPIVSRRPPGNVLAALPLTLLDRCRDRVESLLDRSDGAATAPLKALNAGLARASHAVEQLPGMRLGEQPVTRRGRSDQGWTAAAVVAAASAAALVALARRRPARAARA